MGSTVPKWFRHGAKSLACRANLLARVNGVKVLSFVLALRAKGPRILWGKSRFFHKEANNSISVRVFIIIFFTDI